MKVKIKCRVIKDFLYCIQRMSQILDPGMQETLRWISLNLIFINQIRDFDSWTYSKIVSCLINIRFHLFLHYFRMNMKNLWFSQHDLVRVICPHFYYPTSVCILNEFLPFEFQRFQQLFIFLITF